MDYIIRKATAQDCPAMMDLIRELAVFEREPDAVTVTLDEFVDAGFGEQPTWGAFVAEHHGQVIAMSIFYVRYSTWKGRRLYLEDLIVTESHRGKGVGTLLLDQTIAYARAQKYSGMRWQVLDWNQPAIDMYKKYNTEINEGWLNVDLTFE